MYLQPNEELRALLKVKQHVLSTLELEITATGILDCWQNMKNSLLTYEEETPNPVGAFWPCI